MRQETSVLLFATICGPAVGEGETVSLPAVSMYILYIYFAGQVGFFMLHQQWKVLGIPHSSFINKVGTCV
jgi:hypothetical protein